MHKKQLVKLIIATENRLNQIFDAMMKSPNNLRYDHKFFKLSDKLGSLLDKFKKFTKH